MEANAVQKKLPEVPVTAWGEFTEISKGVLAQMLVNHGIVGGLIGLEMDDLQAPGLECLKVISPR